MLPPDDNQRVKKNCDVYIFCCSVKQVVLFGRGVNVVIAFRHENQHMVLSNYIFFATKIWEYYYGSVNT